MKALRLLALATALGAYASMVLGAYTTASGSGLGCGSSWPTCRGQLLPDLGEPAVAIEFAHRLAALATGFLALGTLAVAWMYHRREGRIVLVATLAFVAITVQVLLGMVTVATELEPLAVTAHTAVAAAFLALATLLVALAWRPRPAPPAPAAAPGDAPPARRGLLARLRDYLLILKPGILFLLLFTAFTATVVASGRNLEPAPMGFALLGGGLAGAAGSALNNYLDRGIDALMVRTRRRPLPAGRIPPGHALLLGLLLAVASFGLLWALVNPLSALLALGGLLFYAPLYTRWLKPRGPQNIVIGGAAGAFPALLGWAAIRGDVGLPALLLAAIVFLWTPPHFWALALVYREDYGRAGIPMMPVVKGERSTKRQILLYTVPLVALSLAFYPLGVLALFYTVLALLLGAILLALAWATLRDPGRTWARHLFSFSIVYLLALLFAMVADRVLA